MINTNGFVGTEEANKWTVADYIVFCRRSRIVEISNPAENVKLDFIIKSNLKLHSGVI